MRVPVSNFRFSPTGPNDRHYIMSDFEASASIWFLPSEDNGGSSWPNTMSSCRVSEMESGGGGSANEGGALLRGEEFVQSRGLPVFEIPGKEGKLGDWRGHMDLGGRLHWNIGRHSLIFASVFQGLVKSRWIAVCR